MHTKFLVRGIPYVPAALVREGSTQGLHFKKLIRQKLSGGSTASTESATDAFTRSNVLVSTVTRIPQLMVADQHILRLMGALEWDKLDQWMKPSPVRILCLWPLLLLLRGSKYQSTLGFNGR
ncbi:hypothetical protein Q3G72_001165 [Acer saccharum]|nr:hypothetical protein Q3G72_001165 [Acer saccharum]